jgi:hypothetical protein
MKENIKFVAITNDDKEIELCITNRNNLGMLINILDKMKIAENKYVKAYIIKEDEEILKRKIKRVKNDK